jgi:hypothetical protein
MSNTGRQTVRKESTVDFILEQVADGTPLMRVLRGEGMPSQTTWYDWCAADEDLAGRFTRARRLGRDMIAMDALEIADNASEDHVIDADGRPVLVKENIQRSKLRVETRLKLLANWEAGSYMNRQIVHDGKPEEAMDVLEAARQRAANRGNDNDESEAGNGNEQD